MPRSLNAAIDASRKTPATKPLSGAAAVHAWASSAPPRAGAGAGAPAPASIARSAAVFSPSAASHKPSPKDLRNMDAARKSTFKAQTLPLLVPR